mgnify:CR=1 FL=1
MKLFFAYLRQRWKVLLGAVLFYALFAVSFALYGLPLAAVWYPAVLTAVLGLIFFLAFQLETRGMRGAAWIGYLVFRCITEVVRKKIKKIEKT